MSRRIIWDAEGAQKNKTARVGHPGLRNGRTLAQPPMPLPMESDSVKLVGLPQVISLFLFDKVEVITHFD